MVVVDGHQHFWDPVELNLPAPPPEAAVLGRAFLPDDLRPEIRSVGVDYTVLVQGYPQSLDCDEWLFRQANATDFVAGVVAWADLTDPASIGGVIDQLQKEGKFVGIRHIVEDEPDLNWLIREPVLESFRELARRDVAYDMLVKPHHLRNVIKVLDYVPGLRMVIDHIAKPNIANGGSTGWEEEMAAIAEHPQVYCKLSGMITEANWQMWKPSDLSPYVWHVVKVFGWDRIMFGSDWPVCLLAGDYKSVWNAINEVLLEMGDQERAWVFGMNAIDFYGLKI